MKEIRKNQCGKPQQTCWRMNHHSYSPSSRALWLGTHCGAQSDRRASLLSPTSCLFALCTLQSRSVRSFSLYLLLFQLEHLVWHIYPQRYDRDSYLQSNLTIFSHWFQPTIFQSQLRRTNTVENCWFQIQVYPTLQRFTFPHLTLLLWKTYSSTCAC